MPRIGATWVKYGDLDFFSSPISVNRQKGENGISPAPTRTINTLDEQTLPIVKAAGRDMLSMLVAAFAPRQIESRPGTA